MRREVPAYTAARGVVLASPLKIIRQSLPMAPGASPALLCLFFLLILGSPQGRLAVAAAIGPAPRGGPGRARPHPGRHCNGTRARARREKPRADPTEGSQVPQGPSGAAGASRPRPSPAAHPAQADGPAPTGAGAGTKATVAQPPVAPADGAKHRQGLPASSVCGSPTLKSASSRGERPNDQ
jgi:hypothetical protein